MFFLLINSLKIKKGNHYGSLFSINQDNDYLNSCKSNVLTPSTVILP